MSKLTIVIADGEDMTDMKSPFPGDSTIGVVDGERDIVVQMSGDIWATHRSVGEPVVGEGGEMCCETEQVYGPADILAHHLAKTALEVIRGRAEPGSIFERCNK